MPTESVEVKGTEVTSNPTANPVQSSISVTALEFVETKPARIRKRKPVGWRPPTSYSLDMRVERTATGYYEFRPSSVVVKRSGVLSGTLTAYEQKNYLPATGLSDSAITQALIALKQQKVNLGVAFAEASKTADFIGDVATRIARAYRDGKKGRWKSVARHLGVTWRETPKTWLQAQYAVKPLLMEAHGAIEELSKNPDTAFICTVRGHAVRDDSNDIYVNGGRGVRFRAVGERRSSCMVRLDYVPDNAFLRSLARTGVTNPAEIAWEIVPFSFVVDWFLPVGDYLHVLDANLGWQFKGGSSSTYRNVTQNVKQAPASGDYLGGSFSGSFKRVKLDRVVFTGSPLPTLPRLKNPLSLGHMANGLALLSQVAKR